MTTEHPDDTRHFAPSQQALGAMETAVQRSRASRNVTMAPVESGAPIGHAVGVPPRQPMQQRFDDGGSGRGSQAWLVAAVVVVAVLVVASGIALALRVGRGSGGPSPSTATSAQQGRSTASPATRGAKKGTTTTIAPSTPGGPPQISSLTPASGSPGQTVTVAGSNFISSDGHIVASFNGQVTATSCPSENMCTLTVPPAASGESSAQVTITTATGTSNAKTFSYS